IRIKIACFRTPSPPLCTKVCFSLWAFDNFDRQKPMIMKQFFNRWRKYLKLSPDAESCLLQQAERRKYHADERLIINDKHPPCLYIIQKGMAFGYMEYDEGDRIPWLAKPMESLTQAFDDIGPYYYATYTLQLATDTTIWCLPIAHL